jgi:hypothetical protein
MTPLHDYTVTRLTELHDHIAEYGVGVWAIDHSKGWYKRRTPLIGSDSIIRRYARALCKEMGRPFVWATHGPGQIYNYEQKEWVDIWAGHVVVRRSQKIHPIVSALLLGAAERKRYQPNAETPLWLVQDGSNWHFGFTGDEGKFLFEHWLIQCRENPDFKKALAPRKPRVPRKVTI